MKATKMMQATAMSRPEWGMGNGAGGMFMVGDDLDVSVKLLFMR